MYCIVVVSIIKSPIVGTLNIGNVVNSDLIITRLPRLVRALNGGNENNERLLFITIVLMDIIEAKYNADNSGLSTIKRLPIVVMAFHPGNSGSNALFCILILPGCIIILSFHNVTGPIGPIVER